MIIRMTTLAILALAALAGGDVIALKKREAPVSIETTVIAYRHGDVELEGYLAAPKDVDAKRPGVLVVHAWMGLGGHERESAEALAHDGFVALALDMYGKGIRPKNRAEAAKQAGIYRGDRALMRARAKAGLDRLREDPRVDRARVAAIGYCFGGGTVLELARSGADVRGVVSFHGNLDTPDPADAKAIRAKVLVLHGAADPHVPPTQVEAFRQEMEKAGVDWQLTMYGGAVHAFTHRDAGNDPSRGAAYHERAATRSWAAMRAFFGEVLK
jgi:dienelactone hydrolase